MNLRAIPVTTIGLLAALSGAALAGPREDVLEALGKCSVVTDDKARLTCYDAISPRLRDALNTPPENLSRPPTKEEEKSWFGFNLDGLFGTSAAAQTTPEKFGADQMASTQAQVQAGHEEVDSISAGVTDYSMTPFGKFIVFLDNGQVWRQIPGDTEPARFSKSGKNTVTIERGALGSYNMHIDDGVKTYKVTRVK